jgi:hypothetical protein
VKIKWCLNDEPHAKIRMMEIADEDLEGLNEEDRRRIIQTYIDDYVRVNIGGSWIDE